MHRTYLLDPNNEMNQAELATHTEGTTTVNPNVVNDLRTFFAQLSDPEDIELCVDEVEDVQD